MTSISFDRVKPLYNILGEALSRVAGIHLHEGKTRVWNRGGIAPGQVEELGPAAWNCDGITVRVDVDGGTNC